MNDQQVCYRLASRKWIHLFALALVNFVTIPPSTSAWLAPATITKLFRISTRPSFEEESPSSTVSLFLSSSSNKNEEKQEETQPQSSNQKNIQSGTVTVLDQGPHHVVVMKPPSVVCHHCEWAGTRQSKQSKKKNKKDNGDDGDEIPMLQRTREALNGERINLIHRLDRGASGCLLCTFQRDEDEGLRTTSTLQKLMTTESQEKTKKTYIALVRGEGVLHGEDFKTKGWFCVDRPIKDEKGIENSATTYFRFVAGQGNANGTLKDRPRASLVLARPVSGRWHQIRRHLNGLSHPILGDATHGNSKTNREWKQKWGLQGERTCLHLARIQLSSTSSSTSSLGENEAHLFPNGIDVSCPLSDDMLSMLENHLPDLLKEAEPILEQEGIFIRSKDHCQVLPYEIEVPS